MPARPFFALALIALLAGCQAAPPPPVLPQMSFAHLAPIKLDVMRVEVTSEYQAPLKPPNVEHLFPTSPEAAMRVWARDRLQAVGNTKIAHVIVREASVTEASLAVDKGFSGMFKDQPSERYDAALSADIVIRDARGQPLAQASGRVIRSRTVLESITLNQREQIWFEMAESMVKDLDQVLERNIRDHMAAHIR